MPYDYDFRLRIAAPRQVVFERLLRIEHLSRWFCGWSRIEPKVGGTFKFGGETCLILPEGKGWETKIDEGEVLRRFAFRWPILSAPTTVSYDLEDAEGVTTTLRAQHRGVPFRDTTCGSVQDAWRMCLGNLKSITEGRGDSVRPDHSPVTSSEVRLSALIEAIPAKVFEPFASPELIRSWLSRTPSPDSARVDRRPGGVVSSGFGDGPDRVIEVDRERRVVLGWSAQPPSRRIQFDLEEKASGTAIYLLETGLGADRADEILRERGRWSDRLVCLKNLVESGSAGFINAYGEQVRESAD